MDVDGEVALLLRKITELGVKDAKDGHMRVKYGVLFRETSDDFEALAGTMRAAKKKVGFRGLLGQSRAMRYHIVSCFNLYCDARNQHV